VQALPRLLGGRYELGRELGSGGMAVVVEAVDRMLTRRVAVKVLFPHLARDPGVVERFRREARSAARLSHPHVVAIFDIGREDGPDSDEFDFIVMELAEGRTLRQEVEAGPLPPAQAAGVAREVCAALAAAHASGLVHRDIKPANVMLGPSDRVKVMDFGIAHAVDTERLTQTGMAIGTAQYASPEQLRGQAVDARSDLYSLGCCLYEMLVGTAPFAGTSAISVAFRQVNEAPVPVRERNPRVPAALSAVVARAIEKDPARRFQTAAEFDAELSRLLPGLQPLGLPLTGAPAREAEAGAGGADTTPIDVVGGPDVRPPVEDPAADPAGRLGDDGPPGRPARSGRRRVRLVLGAGLAAVCLLAAGLGGRLLAGTSAAPGTTAPQAPTVSTTSHPPAPSRSADTGPTGAVARTAAPTSATSTSPTPSVTPTTTAPPTDTTTSTPTATSSPTSSGTPSQTPSDTSTGSPPPTSGQQTSSRKSSASTAAPAG
jgi:serine/threonine protein kinase